MRVLLSVCPQLTRPSFPTLLWAPRLQLGERTARSPCLQPRVGLQCGSGCFPPRDAQLPRRPSPAATARPDPGNCPCLCPIRPRVATALAGGPPALVGPCLCPRLCGLSTEAFGPCVRPPCASVPARAARTSAERAALASRPHAGVVLTSLIHL